MNSLLLYAAPVAYAALGETVAQKAGVINIGLEGTMLAGAFFATWGTLATGSAMLGLLIGICAALIIGLIFGFYTVVRAADQVVVGTAINLLVLGLTGSIYRSDLGRTGNLLRLPALPTFGGGWDAILVLLPVSVVGIWFLLQRTAFGLALRSVGEYPKAAEASGFSPIKLRLTGILIGAFFGGLGGAYLAVGVTHTFAENMTAGRGFVAIAMVTFGRWKPMWVFAAAVLIGWAESVQYTLQATTNNIPSQVFIAMPYVIALAVLVVVGKGTVAPAALAQPYVREK